nr:hypothetical protein [Leuven Picorna-like virus 2]
MYFIVNIKFNMSVESVPCELRGKLDPQLEMGYHLGTYVLSKANFKEKLSDYVRAMMNKATVSVAKGTSDQVVTTFMSSLSAHLSSEEGKQDLQNVCASMADAITDQCKASLVVTTTCSERARRLGRTLVMGLTYWQALGDTTALAVMCGFLLGDVLDQPVYKTALCIKLFTLCFGCTTNQQPQGLSVQAAEDTLSQFTEALTAVWQVIALALGVTLVAPKSIKTLAVSLMGGVNGVAKSTNNVLKFFSLVCKGVYRIYAWIADHVFGVKPLHRMLYQDDGIMQAWVGESCTLLDPANEPFVIDNKAWHGRLVSAYLVGKFFIKEVSRAGVKDQPPTLLSTQKRLHDLYVKSLNLGIASSYRPEPVCIWFAGPPGVGKSFKKDEIIKTLLKACGVATTGNDCFTINFSQKHWTGAENKAVVYYDDFGTVDSPEFLGEGIGQFMQLISDSRFAPPQASLEDKGKPVAPALVYCNANETNPVYLGVRDHVAFFRRRHFCVELVLSDEFKRRFGMSANLETEGAMTWLSTMAKEGDTMPHARYRFYDPVSGKSKGSLCTYEQMLEKLVVDVVARYDVSKCKYRTKLDDMTSLSDIPEETPLQEVLDEIQSRVEQLVNPGKGFKDIFKSMYAATTDVMSGASTVARGWLTDLTGLGTQAEDDEDPPLWQTCELPGVSSCACSTQIHEIVEWTDKGFTFCGEPYDVTACEAGSCCALRTDLYKGRLHRLRMYDTRRGRIYDALLKALYEEKPKYGYELKEALDRKALTMDLTRIRARVPEKKWSTTVVISARLLGAVAVLFALRKICKYFFSSTSSEKETGTVLSNFIEPGPRQSLWSQLLSSGDNHTSRAAIKRVGIARKTFINAPQALVAVSDDDNDTLEAPVLGTQSPQFLPLLEKATGFLVMDGVDRASQKPIRNFLMRVFCLGGRTIIMPKHYAAKMKRCESYVLRFYDPRGTCVFDQVELTHLKELDDSELMTARVPSTIPIFKDMRRHIMRESESVRLTSKAVAYEKGMGVPPIPHPINIKIARDVLYQDDGVPYVLPCAISYQWQAPGRCMCPIFSTLTGDKIIGFHVVGGDKAAAGSGAPVGCAEPVCYETFADMDLGLTAMSIVETQGYDMLEVASPLLTLNSNLVELGVTQPKFAVKPADKTSIVPTLIHGYVPVQTGPAPLKPDDVGRAFSPLQTGVEKHGMPPKLFPAELLKRAQGYLRDQYMTACKPVRSGVGVLSEEEAVIGLPGIDGYQSMELSTSEGYPYTAHRPQGESNKRYLITISEDRTSVAFDPLLSRELAAKEEMRSRGIVPVTVFTDCLKDARISLDKIRVPGKTRIFSISPTDFTIQFRQYFLDILAAQKVNRLDLEHAVGINVHSIEWTMLARRLLEVGDNILCGDYSNFGPGLSTQAVEAVGEVWVDWYRHHEKGTCSAEELERRARVRTSMFEEMRLSVHLCGNILYQAPCGSPSGAPCTVNVNNDVNKLYIYMAWLTCFQDNPLMCNIVAFKKHCRLFVYGDDLVCGVSNEIKDRFNNEFLQKFLAEHGIRYTDETKSGTINKYVPFSQAGFLKGVWVPHPERSGVLCYGLAKKSLEDIANWCKKGTDMVECTKQAICDSLMLAYGWGEDYFNEHRDRLMAAWSELPESGPLSLYTYYEMDEMRFGWSNGESIDVDLESLIEKEKAWRARVSLENKICLDWPTIMGAL